MYASDEKLAPSVCKSHWFSRLIHLSRTTVYNLAWQKRSWSRYLRSIISLRWILFGYHVVNSSIDGRLVKLLDNEVWLILERLEAQEINDASLLDVLSYLKQFSATRTHQATAQRKPQIVYHRFQPLNQTGGHCQKSGTPRNASSVQLHSFPVRATDDMYIIFIWNEHKVWRKALGFQPPFQPSSGSSMSIIIYGIVLRFAESRYSKPFLFMSYLI